MNNDPKKIIQTNNTNPDQQNLQANQKPFFKKKKFFQKKPNFSKKFIINHEPKNTYKNFTNKSSESVANNSKYCRYAPSPEVVYQRKTNLKLSGLQNENKFRKEIDSLVFNQRNKVNSIPTKIYALGGVEEIGKNMYCIEHDDEILIIDCGIKFANKKELPGISGIIPSFSYLKENESKIKVLIVTHGHEDHIGGISYLLKKITVPKIYAPVIASELIRRKVGEHKDAIIHEMEVFWDNSVFYTKHFVIDFYRVNHSIPDSFGVALSTPNGVIASSGDFRFDFGSNVDKTNINKISQISDRGLNVLLCESTNAEQDGFNESEENVMKELNNIISSAHGRIIVTSFASNLGRVEEIIKLAVKRNRKIIIIGRSMTGNIAVSRKVGYLKINDQSIVQPKEIDKYPDEEILILCTGSQGEETAALNTLAQNKHSFIKLKPTDSIILSSNAIPGNYVSVDEVVNRLHKSGAKVYVNSSNLKIHSSGHAAKLEQQLLINVFNPKYVVPIHGEYKMLRALQSSCQQLGIPKEKILIISNGQVLHLLNGELYHSDENVDASEVYIDGNDATMEGSNIIQDRFDLAEKGLVMVQIYFDLKKRELINLSPISTAGSFYTLESIELLKRINYLIRTDVNKLFDNTNLPISEKDIEKIVRQVISVQIWRHKNKKPLIVIETINTTREKIFQDAIKLPSKKSWNDADEKNNSYEPATNEKI